MYARRDDATSNGTKLDGRACRFYLNFINLFMMMLRLAGNRPLNRSFWRLQLRKKGTSAIECRRLAGKNLSR